MIWTRQETQWITLRALIDRISIAWKHCHWTLTATLFSKKHYHTKKTGFPSFLIHATTQHLASRISGSLMNTPVLRNLSCWLAYFRIFGPAMDGTWLCKICDHGMFLKFGIIKQNCSISQGSLLLKGFCGSWVISPCTCRVDGGSSIWRAGFGLGVLRFHPE